MLQYCVSAVTVKLVETMEKRMYEVKVGPTDH